MSDDGATAVVVIAMFGNPFSPAYAAACRRAPADPLRFCSMNVAVYGRTRSAWAFQEHALDDGARDATGVQMGQSSMRWRGDALVVEVNERTTPLGPRFLQRELRGTLVVHPEALTGRELSIDPDGEHRWWPVAPLARVSVDFPDLGVRFSGHGYHDANAAPVSLESTFEHWSWSRARLPDCAVMTYDVSCVSGAQRSRSFKVTRRGELTDFDEPWRTPLGRSLWGLPRHAPADAGVSARIHRSLEDGPFYARTLVETRLEGRSVLAMHETLAGHRLRRRIVQRLAAYKMRPAR